MRSSSLKRLGMDHAVVILQTHHTCLTLKAFTRRRHHCLVIAAIWLPHLLQAIKKMKLSFYGQVSRMKGSCMEKEIIQGITPGQRRRGRPKTNNWHDNITEWTGLKGHFCWGLPKTEDNGERLFMKRSTLGLRTTELQQQQQQQQQLIYRPQEDERLSWPS